VRSSGSWLHRSNPRGREAGLYSHKVREKGGKKLPPVLFRNYTGGERGEYLLHPLIGKRKGRMLPSFPG